MRTFVKAAMALGLAACLGTSAQAQGPGGRGGMGMGGGLNLLTNKGVQKELKLTDEQVEKADKAAADMREKMMPKYQELRSLEGDERTEKMAELQKEATAETKKVTGSILKPEQAKRFDQIALQVRGVQAFADPEIQGKLKLTDDQKSKIKDMGDDLRSKMGELRSEFGNDFQGMMKKSQEMQKEAAEKVKAMMTDDQKATWKDMTGEPFDYKPEQAPRRQQ